MHRSEATDTASPRFREGQLAMVNTLLAPGMCVVTTYSLALAGGWRPSGYRAVTVSRLVHATVETECGATDGGERVRWLTGPTALTHFACRDAATVHEPCLGIVSGEFQYYVYM